LKQNKTLIQICGPTGIGKTSLAIKLANFFKSEIISSDSRQFYHEMKIGTAMPTKQELAEVKHHFIGNRSIHNYYNVSMFEMDSLELLNRLFLEYDMVFMVGGSGLYMDAISHGIDDLPKVDLELRNSLEKKLADEGIESLRFELKHLDIEYYNSVDLKNHKRIIRALEVCMSSGKTYTSFRKKKSKKREFNIAKIALNCDRKILYERIDKRVDLMISKGLLDEARNLYKYRKLNALNTVGYKELFEYFDENISLEKAIELIKRNSRRYAKRQLSWFGRDNNIIWFQPSQLKEMKLYIS
jgi:tRNA dimethylallyltransferase